MRLLNTLAITAATASALSFSDVTEYSNSAIAAVKRTATNLLERKDGGSGGGKSCPAVWGTIAGDLKKRYVGSDGKCTDDARAAIREAFHDCGAWNLAQGQKGGCDGSLINTRFPQALGGQNEELNRGENGGLSDISSYLWGVYQTYKKIDSSVTVADLIQFSASIAIVACPGGPQIKTYVGRKDSATPAPGDLLPSVVADASSLYKLFSDKGFDAVELAALLGAHSTSKAFGQAEHGIPVGAPQDSTAGDWDVKYYSETLSIPVTNDASASNQKVAVFPSDKNLATDDKTPVKKEFAGFVNNQGKWRGKFADA